MSVRMKVILDTDPGIDDSAALCMLLQAHKKNAIELVAITTVTGNSSLENVIINTYRTLEVQDMVEIPVFPGASKGLVSTFKFDEPPFHGYDGFGDVIHDPPPPSLSRLKSEHAVLALNRLVEENKGEIVVIAVGPLTNIALTMSLYPDWTNKLKDFYVMGGSLYGKGNLTITGEFNITCDPEAAKVVFERTTIPIKLNTLEPCGEAFHISYNERRELGATESPTASFLNLIEGPSLAFREYKEWFTYDQLSAAWFLDEYVKSDLISSDAGRSNGILVTETGTAHVLIETTGQLTRGQMIVDWRNKLKRKKNAIYIKSIDKEIYMKYLKLAFV